MTDQTLYYFIFPADEPQVSFAAGRTSGGFWFELSFWRWGLGLNHVPLPATDYGVVLGS